MTVAEIKPMTLHDIADAFVRLQELDGNTGDLHEYMESVECDFVTKLQNAVSVVLNLESSASLLSQEAGKLRQKSVEMEERARWLRDYICECMMEAGRDSYDLYTLARSVAVHPSPPSVQVDDAESVPDTFVKREPRVLKSDILKHWKATGEAVPGCRILTDRHHLRINLLGVR